MTAGDETGQQPAQAGPSLEADAAAERRALQAMLTNVVEQLAQLRQHVVQLEIDKVVAQAHEPDRNATMRSRLLREIDAVEVLARGAKERAFRNP